MNAELDKSDIFLIRLLLKSRTPVFAGTIVGRFGISYRDIIRTVKGLDAFGLVSISDSTISLTPLGRKWALSNQEKFRDEVRKEYFLVPERFKCTPIAPFAPYAPKTSKLDRKFFSLHEKNDE